jgi:hypothetical protein
VLRLSCIFLTAVFFVATSFAQEMSAQRQTASKTPVDQLIPWLLDEDRQLRGVDRGVLATTNQLTGKAWP